MHHTTLAVSVPARLRTKAEKQASIRGIAFQALGIGLFLLALWLSSFQSYLLFHSLTEMFSVAVAAGVFMIAWNSRDFPESRAIPYLGIGLLFAALVDVLHTLTYQGMVGVVGPPDAPTRLWLVARFLQALGLLLFGVSLHRRRHLPYWIVYLAGAAITVFLLASIFQWGIFPVCFVEGTGITPFKRWSEYALSAMFAAAMALVLLDRTLGIEVRGLLAASVGLTVASELAFTLYTSPYGTWNMIGHLAKIAAFILVYRALVAGEVRRRIAVIKELADARDAALASERVMREANAAKDKFFSLIAHDMRNPLAGLHSVAKLLDERYDEIPKERQRKLSRLIVEGAGQGLALMESLLLWARAQSGKIPFKPGPIELGPLAQEAIAMARGNAEGKGIALGSSVPSGIVLFADRDMILTVLRNLLSNAIKFTARGGSVELGAREEPREVEVWVRDTGVGIERAEIDRLFRIDVHVASPGTEQETGNGLGLLLCKEFVEKNGGRIAVESSPGEGSRFSFVIPRAPASAPIRSGDTAAR